MSIEILPGKPDTLQRVAKKVNLVNSEDGMNRAILDLLGIKVAVSSNPTGSSDCEDAGILEGYEGSWVRLRKSRSEVICFPVYNIRLIKNLEPLKKVEAGAEDMLLRPVDSAHLPS